MAIEIKEAIASEELRSIAELAEKIWHECYSEILSAQQIDYMVEKFQSYQAMVSQIEKQNYRYYAVYDDGEICGYIGAKPESDDRYFLSKLYLKQDKRGRGIARLMMNSVFTEARNAGKKRVYLTVNKYNNHSINVYKRIGFEVIDSVVTDIGGGYVMDDYVMEYKL
ncbi:MAG: GNAT family N-acetyltransferase [Ruminococcus sp.]|nr:GNAT family N-acetyltransferase [Ruminococcus sp.]